MKRRTIAFSRVDAGMRHTRAIVLSFATLGLVLAGPRVSGAETPGPVPFSRLDIALRAVADVSNTEFHDYWEQGRGAELSAATPFYAGDVALVARFVVNEQRAGTGVPDLQVLTLAGGWSIDRHLALGVRGGLGAAIGFSDWFVSEDTPKGAHSEIEFGTEANVRLARALGAAWRVEAIGTWQVTFTRERIELGMVSLGLARSFVAPGWIRSVLE